MYIGMVQQEVKGLDPSWTAYCARIGDLFRDLPSSCDIVPGYFLSHNAMRSREISLTPGGTLSCRILISKL